LCSFSLNFESNFFFSHFHSRETFFTFLITTFLCWSCSHAVVLKCDFKNFRSFYGVEYTCEVHDLIASQLDRTITGVEGKHTEKQTNADVKKLYFKKQFCQLMLRNISSNFPNLEILYVMNSNLQQLLEGDLDGLTKLKVLDVSHNPITELGENVFKGHSTIEKISFFDCHLKRIHPKALDPLINLSAAYFDHNVCTEFRCDTEYEVEVLKFEIRKKCQSDSYEQEPHKNPSIECDKTESLSFGRRNAYSIIFFLLFCMCALGCLLVLIVKKNPWVSTNIVRLEEYF
jgi:hypothetical protein